MASWKNVHAGYTAWILSVAVAALCLWAVARYAYFPGDVAVERWVQSLFSQDMTWAVDVSKSAEFPWLFVILALAAAFSWVLDGWRAALLSIVSLAGMLALGMWLGPIIARPRPSPDLVRVMRPLPGYAFPSLFALRYAATFGFLAVLAAVKGHGVVRPIVPVVCSALLVLGWFARIALAAHWPSDVIISYYLGLFWAALLIWTGSKGFPTRIRSGTKE